jgi:AraC-like DNA-binding protein
MNRTSGFYLDDAGYTVVPANSVSSPATENHSQEYQLSWEKGRVLRDFQVVYITQGKGIFQSTQGGKISVNAGDAFLLFPGEWYRYQPDPEVGWTEFWISFSGEGANKLVSGLLLSPLRPVIRIGHNEALFQLFSTLAKTMRINPFSNPLLTATQGMQVLAHLTTSTQRPRGTYGEPIETALRHISECVEQRIDYDTLARKVGMSYSVFRREFQRVTELPPGQYQLMLRMSKARELLCETTLPIGEIAEQLGFESPYYFSRFFKAKVGMTARKFRQTSS